MQRLSDSVTSVGPLLRGPKIYAQCLAFSETDVASDPSEVVSIFLNQKIKCCHCGCMPSLQPNMACNAAPLRQNIPWALHHVFSVSCVFGRLSKIARDVFVVFSACMRRRPGLNCPSEWNWSRLARLSADICLGVGHATILSFRCLSYIFLSWSDPSFYFYSVDL